MKKRLLSLFLVIAMLCAMTIGASAVSASGVTSGGSPSLSMNTSAWLSISATNANAGTSSDNVSAATFLTQVTFYYYNAPGNVVNAKSSGSRTASVYPSDVMNGTSAIRAESHHEVSGGSYGDWACNLTEYR